MPDVVLPVLNEAEAIPVVLSAMPTGYRPIVVDNGSTDDSRDVAHSFGALVIAEPRRGFGAACHAGLIAADAEIVCFMDCDGSLDPLELPRVAEPVACGEADLMLGARDPVRGAWPWPARAANALLTRQLRARTGIRVSDLGPMRAGRRTELIGLDLRDRHFGYPLEMVVRAKTQGWRIGEVRVAYAPRLGRSKVTGTVGGSARAALDMTVIMHRLAPAAAQRRAR